MAVRWFGTLTGDPHVASPVPQDRSLDEFATVTDGTDGGGESVPEEADDAEGVEDPDDPLTNDGDADSGENHERPDTARNDPDLAPIESTYAWSPDGGACERCGADAASRWRHDGELVCPACKDW